MTKITNYPEALDTVDNLPDISGSDRMNQPGLEHDVQHTRLNQAVIQLQKKVGKDQSEDQTSLDWRVKNLEDNGGGGGGSGVEIGTDDTIAVGGNTEIQVPERPYVWLQVTIEGADYVIPGFKVGALAEPTNLNWSVATITHPTALEAELVWNYTEE